MINDEAMAEMKMGEMGDEKEGMSGRVADDGNDE